MIYIFSALLRTNRLKLLGGNDQATQTETEKPSLKMNPELPIKSSLDTTNNTNNVSLKEDSTPRSIEECISILESEVSSVLN